MEERQKIQAQLAKMRQECVREYLEEKLQQITSKQVIHDILQQFLQVNNQQFLGSIADNIQEAKQQNRTLKSQLEALKEQAEQRLQQTTQAIHQECQQMLMQEVAGVRKQAEASSLNLRAQKDALQRNNEALELQRQQLLDRLKIAESDQQAMEGLKAELAESKRSFINFKESCEKIIYEGNREKQREKQRMLDEWRVQRESLESQIEDRRVSHQLEQELQTQIKKIMAKDDEILQLDQALQQSSQKMEEITELYSHLTNMYEQSKIKQSQATAQLSNLVRINQSNQLSLNYLKEENSYLREEILSFSSRYQKLQKDKALLHKQLTEYKKVLTKKNQQHDNIQKQQKQQFSIAMAQYKDKYQIHISQMLAQLSKMKEQLQTYSQIILEKENLLSTLNQKNAALRKSNFSLQEQLNAKANNTERHEFQVEQYENELTKIRQDCRQEIEAAKRNFEANWNSKNEELIEQKYICQQLNQKIEESNFSITQLHQEIASLHQDISIKDEKDQYYKLVTQEIKTLKKKISSEQSGDYNKNTNNQFSHRFLSKQSKIYFLICQMQKDISLLKRSNQQLRLFALKSVGQICNYIQQTTAYGLAKTQSNHSKQQDPFHQVNLKNNMQLKLLIRNKEDNFGKKQESFGKKEQMFNRTVQQRANTQPSSNLTQIKKTLKNIQQRYQTVQQENKYYSTHLDTYIKQA